MKYLVLLFFITITQLTFGQKQRALEKTLGEQVYEEMTMYGIKVLENRRVKQNKALQEFGFSDIKTLEVDFAFRYCTKDGIIEVIENDGILKGTISIFFKGTTNINSEKKENNLVSERLSIRACKEIQAIFLMDSTVKKINNTYYNSLYNNIENYSLELVKDGEYFFNLYRLPNYIYGMAFFDEKLNESILRIKELSSYDEVKKRFYKENPYQYYFFWNGVYLSHRYIKIHID